MLQKDGNTVAWEEHVQEGRGKATRDSSSRNPAVCVRTRGNPLRHQRSYVTLGVIATISAHSVELMF